MLGQTFNIPGQAPGAQKLCHLLSDESLLRRLSPGNTGEDCVSALRSLNLPDSFWTDEFKVVPCAKTYSHKWTLCPCAHIGETARRRCPRTVNYKAVLCPLVKAKKTCPLGDSCSYAHNVFEHWLHPSRYKTRLCSFGRNCNRSICFFAHSAEELRCVPSTDDKEGDEREYLMQFIMAQENGLLPSSSGIEPIQPAPIPPIIPNLMPDLGSALHQALQQPLPPSNRPSMSGLPDAATILSARQSMSGIPDLMTSGRASMPGLADSGAAAFRASMSGVPDAPGMMMPGRPSLSGLPDRPAFVQARGSLNGLHEGLARGRPSLNGIPDHMLLSMGGMQRAMSTDLNTATAASTMQRAMSHELGAPFHTAAAMQQVLGFEQAAAAAAAAVAMERAFSRELAAGGAASPLQTATAALERAYSQRDVAAAAAAAAAGANGIGGGSSSLSSRSLGSGHGRRDHINLAHAPSINSVESDSLVQLRSGINAGAPGAASTGFAAAGGAMGFDALMNPQAPPRLSDPGASLQMAAASGTHMGPHGAGAGLGMARASDSGKLGGLLGANDLAGLESLLPLMNNALASGALALPGGSGGAAAGGYPGAVAVRRSNSGSNSGRVLSPQLLDNNSSGSPQHSGSLTPLSTNSTGEPVGLDGGLQPHQQQLLAQLPGSPPGAADAAAFEGVMRGVKAAAAQKGVAGFGLQNGAGGGVDQSYLNDLVARLQDQGVNREQLVSSLSQLLAQLLAVGS